MPVRYEARLVPGLATGVGSLPFTDAAEASASVLRLVPDMPFAPELPARSPHESMIGQWARALPEVQVRPDGGLEVDSATDPDAPPVPAFDRDAHGGLLAFTDALAVAEPAPVRVKVQCTGPLTLGLALIEAGMPAARAFRRAAAAVRAWVPALESLVHGAVDNAGIVVFLDEPGLVAWKGGAGPIEHEAAVDLLSGALTAASSTTGVHVCGEGEIRIAFEAGPTIVGAEVRSGLLEHAAAIARHLERGGWFAWGAVPTDRPVGERVEPLWRELALVLCELAVRGCDPISLRTQAIITPACGLAGHGVSQAERALRLSVELATRVHDQALAARLTLGA